MAPSSSGELYYPNKLGLITLRALEEVMGKNALHQILNIAGAQVYQISFPPDNLEKGLGFSKLSGLGLALEKMYGPRAASGLALRAGKAAFPDILRNFGALAGISDLPLAVVPFQARVRIGLNALAKMFMQLTDQQTGVEERGHEFIWSTHDCPYCWGRHGEHAPVCYLTAGLLQEFLAWVSGGDDFRVRETKCIAVGGDVCEFTIGRESR